MNNILKDLLRLLIIIVVLCAVVYFMEPTGLEGKSDILYGVVGGGVTAFIAMYIFKKIKEKKEKDQ
ncbi:MAG: hypothetical protein J6Y35_04375 [Bacteroidales bacterium]|nr:hypothetical protein [Bacteroidales bacterium]